MKKPATEGKSAFDLPFRQRLPTKLGAYAVLFGLLIGVVLSILQVMTDFQRERASIAVSIQQLTSTLKDAAAVAAYNIDDESGVSVLSGLFAFPAVSRAEIIDEFGQPFVKKTRREKPAAPNFIARMLVGEDPTREVELIIPNIENPVGVLRVWFDANLLAENFGSRVWLVIAAGILRNLFLAALLTIVFYRLITKPLAVAVEQIQTERGHGNRSEEDGDIVDVPKSHENDELGMLLKSVNDFAKESRDAGKDLQISHDQLVKLNDQKNKFFSIIAHDLKSPFNALLGYSHMLSTEVAANDPKKVIEYSANLHEAGQQVFKLLNNLLEWSLLQMGKTEFSPAVVDLKQIIENNIDLYKPMAVSKGIELSSGFNCDASVYADVQMTDTVIRNLVNNAIKFTPEKGVVSVSTHQKGSKIEIKVTDNGVGMPSNKLSELFELDKKNSTTGTDGEVGTGLGLHLCKELIEKQGGELVVESRVGQGSTFCFCLPLFPEEPHP